MFKIPNLHIYFLKKYYLLQFSYFFVGSNSHLKEKLNTYIGDGDHLKYKSWFVLLKIVFEKLFIKNDLFF